MNHNTQFIYSIFKIDFFKVNNILNITLVGTKLCVF